MYRKAVCREANLKQYRAVNGKWQFVPVMKSGGNPEPPPVLIEGKPKLRKSGGKSYQDWSEDGKRKTRIVGTSQGEPISASN